MTEQVGPWGNKPESTPGLRVLQGDEASLSGFHRGQQSEICANRPNVRLQPYPNDITRRFISQIGRRPCKGVDDLDKSASLVGNASPRRSTLSLDATFSASASIKTPQSL